ncbi:hypothetical protein [Brevundimonas sp. Root1423]|uniref:hypothetical protein n=1 Tax=Brevundimonas sp. Root1423 TaxID=1736462 RepID=UPI0012E36BA8|nr:hypothetical protein [Brevundimonas sp. Root1423]
MTKPLHTNLVCIKVVAWLRRKMSERHETDVTGHLPPPTPDDTGSRGGRMMRGIAAACPTDRSIGVDIAESTPTPPPNPGRSFIGAVAEILYENLTIIAAWRSPTSLNGFTKAIIAALSYRF